MSRRTHPPAWFTSAASEQRRAHAQRAAAAAHKKRIQESLLWIRLAERVGEVVTLPSGKQVRKLGRAVVYLGSVVSLRSGRLKYEELDGCRLSPSALSREDKRFLKCFLGEESKHVAKV